jgi:hypothetical protein
MAPGTVKGVGGLGQLLWAIITTAVFCIPIALSLWALLDCARRPSWTWAMTTRSQQVWMASILCGILLVPAGLIISTWYLVRIRPEVAAIEDGRFPGLDTEQN